MTQTTASTMVPSSSHLETQAPPTHHRVTASLSPSQIRIIKSTAPALQEHGAEITTLFYNTMLENHPELRNIFNQTHQKTGKQPRALAAAVIAYASYVDDLGQLQAAVEHIAQKHVSVNILPEHYPIVGKYLIQAVAAVLGDAVTPAVADAWTAAYQALADIFINREAELYKAHENWQGWRRFKIQRKEVESAGITSFYLVPEDGQPLPMFKPGQYISLQIKIPQLGIFQSRQYSLSDAPRSEYYRISVKKEAGLELGIPGLISTTLHDQYEEGHFVELTHPAGEFFLDTDEDTEQPAVLLSAGVGSTPMLSMLNTIVNTGSRKPVSFIHGAHSFGSYAFGQYVKSVTMKNSNIKSKLFLTNVSDQDMLGVQPQFHGHMDLAKVDADDDLYLNNSKTTYYICGPESFMADMRKFLLDWGVGPDRIHVEVFGVGSL